MGERIKEVKLNIWAIVKSPNFEKEIQEVFDKIETETGLYYAPSSKGSKRVGIKTVGLALPIVFLSAPLALGAIPLVDHLVKNRKAKELYGEEFDPVSYSEGLISLPFENLKRTLLTDVKIPKSLKVFLTIYSSRPKYTVISHQGNALINGIEVPVEIVTAGEGTAKEFAGQFSDRRPEINDKTMSVMEFSRMRLVTSL